MRERRVGAHRPQSAEELREAQQDMQTELRAKIAELQREMNMKALSTVMSKSKIERMMGEPFAFEATQRPAFGRPGGGRGDRGGDARDRERGTNRRRERSARPESEDSDNESSNSRRNRRR